jgi:DNA-binding NarL/FixJ family response regulator
VDDGRRNVDGAMRAGMRGFVFDGDVDALEAAIRA